MGTLIGTARRVAGGSGATVEPFGVLGEGRVHGSAQQGARPPERAHRLAGRRRVAGLTALTLLLAFLVPLAPGVPSREAAAVTLPSGLQTGFQIDGDKTSGTPPDTFDWNDVLQPQPSSTQTPTFVPTAPYTTAGGFRSSGVFAGGFFWDDGAYSNCDGQGTDPTANQGSQNGNTNPWVAAPANVQDKANLCSAGYATEALSDETGLRHFIMYGYFTRRAGNGSVSIYTVFEGPEPGRCDDLLLDVLYAEGTTRFLEWTPTAGDGCANPDGAGTWSTTGRAVDFAFAMGQRTEAPPLGNQQQDTFGEYAIDLTAAGLFGDDQCSTFAITSLMSRTGAAETATIADFFFNTPEPLEISNCGTLTVTKRTPTGQTDDDFAFRVTNESSQGVVVPPDRTSIEDTVRAGQTRTYENVLSSSLLHLEETGVPPPWELTAAECAYTDQVGERHTVDVTDPATPFTLLGGGRTDCTLTNDAALVTVTKQTLPDGAVQDFDFAVGDETATLGDGESQTFAVPAGDDLTVAEDAVDGWMTPEVRCTDGTTQTGASVTVTPVVGENLGCTFTNTQLATVTIEKRVPQDSAGTSFDFTGDLGEFTLTPVVVPQTTNATDSQQFEVPPGEYSVSEEVPEGYLLADLSCWDPPYDYEAELDVEPPTATFTVRPGSQLTCSFEDIAEPEGATLVVQKATAPMVEWDADFPFAVTGPEGFDDAAFTLNTVGDDWSWVVQEIPAGDYTITEDELPGWGIQDVVCQRADGADLTWSRDGAATDVTLEDGAIVTCLYSNLARPARATLTKTTANIGPDLAWSVDVSLSPDPGTSTTLTGTGPGSASTSWGELVPGQRYVVREQPLSGWTMGPITCTDADGTVADLDGDDLTFTFVAGVAQELSCGMTNTGQPSSVSLRKVTTGLSADYPWSYDVQITPVPEGATNPTTVSGVGQSAVTVGWDNLLPGQTYEVTEVNLPDEVTQRLETCTGGGVDQIEGGFRFVAPLDASVSCSLTNFVAPVEATLTKTTTEGDGSFTFDLTTLGTGDTPATVPITTTAGSGSAALSLVPGVRYSLVERDQPGWVEGEIVCTVTPATGDEHTIEDVTDFTVSVGDSVACTVENDIAPGTVSFTKHTAGITDDYEWSFPVTLTPQGGDDDAREVSGTGPGSSSVAWEDLEPGRYTLQEGGLEGWDAGPITCGLGGGDDDPFTPGVQLDIEPGQSYACSATNTALPASATIRKRTAGIGDTLDWSFDLTLSPAPEGQDGTVTLSGTGPGLGDDSHTWTELSPGSVYSLTEAGPGAGWTAEGIVCDDGTGASIDASRLVVAPGAEYTCVADNSAPAVTGSITKTSVGGDGDFAFLLDTVPSSGAPTTVPVTTSGGTGSVDLPTLLPGNRYSLTEQAVDGWRQTGPLACTRTPSGGDPTPIADLTDFGVQAGDSIACTAENTADGRVILYKEVHGTGDQARDFDFTSNVDGHEAFTVEGVRDDGTLYETVIEDVAPGQDYFFEETTDNGDPKTVLADLSCTYGGEDHSGTPEDRENRRLGFEVLPGETTECYFTNAVEGSLILIKRSVPANFDQDFDFTVTGPSIAPEDEAFVINSDPSVDGAIRSWTGLLEGTYTLTEGEMPSGWSLNTLNDATFCNTADGWTLDPQARSITVELEAADVVTCFFSNRAATASVEVTKTAEGLADGTPWSFPVTLSPAAGVTPGGTQTVSGTAPGSGTVSWSNLTPGVTYTLSEPAPGGWTSGGLECSGLTDASPAAGFQFVAGVGQSLECTLVNTAAAASVTVTKTVSGIAAGLSWSFELTLTPDADPAGPQAATGTGNATSAPVTWTDLVPGTRYTLAETPQAGWVLGLVQCPGLTDESADPGFQFTATPGLALQCGVANAGAASRVSVVKTTTGVADEVAWSFPVTISPAASPQATQNLTGTGSATSAAATWTGLVPGVTYTLSEALPAGWTGGTFTCTVGGTSVDDASGAAGFQLVAGLNEVVSCAVANAARPADVTVTKTVTGVDGDLDWSFDVSLTPAATPGNPVSLTGTGNGTSAPATFTDLVPGTLYTLTENLPAGWTSPGFTCAGITDLDPETAGLQLRPTLGQSLTCGVANAAAPAELSFVKTVEGVADDHEWSFPVTLDPPAGGVGTQDATGTGNAPSSPLGWTGLVPGTSYDLTEVADGYDAGEMTCDVDDVPIDLGVRFTPEPGDDISCAVTNAAVPADLSVTKTVTGAPDDTAWSFAVTLTPPGAPEGTRTLTGTGDETSDPGTWAGLVPGATYTLVESEVPAGWTAGGFSCTSAGDLLEDASEAPGFQLVPVSGQDVACDVVNSPDPATGTITKTAVGDDGDFVFVLTPEGQPDQTVTVTTAGGSGSADLPELLPGVTYALGEQQADGWTATETLACTVTPAGGGDATPVADLGAFTVDPGAHLDCSATNTRLGRIVVVKAVDGADAEFGFTGSWLDPEDFTITTSGGTGARTFEDVAPGEHTLAEVARDGYEGTGLVCTDSMADGATSTVDGLDATIALDPGETVTCTYSNTRWGVLVVDKTTVPPSDQEFGFAWGPAGGAQERFTLADADEPFTTPPLEPGTYTVAEDGADGWQLQGLDCTGSSGQVTVDGANATVDVRAGDTVLCRFTNARAAALTVEKEVVSGPVDRGAGVFELGYRITVGNPGGVSQRYDLSDRLRFGGGIRVVAARVVSSDARINPRWDGTGDATVVAGASVAAGASHRFDVTVSARVPDSVLDAARVCQGAVGAERGSGFLNTATLLGPDGEAAAAEACSDVPPARPTPSPTPSAPSTPSTPSPGATSTASPPGAGPAPDAGPGWPLPVTGLEAGIAGLAVVLLLAGLVLVLVRRRRS
ncbi:hypothetical protein [Isoptericola sp. NPDC057191]|uniref:prealbumin-like fold domain-containing protein n=1 Tax=Isoptericola sp. NPDC057191 TaxID=3346041 RepID=UPI00362E2D86